MKHRKMIQQRNPGLIASEERVNVNHRWLGTSVVRVRILAAGLVLLGAGCAVLGWGSRSRQTTAHAAAQPSEIGIPGLVEQSVTMPSLAASAQSSPSDAKAEMQSRARSLF